MANSAVLAPLEDVKWGETETVADCLNPVWKNAVFTIRLLEKMPSGGRIGDLNLSVFDEDKKIRTAAESVCINQILIYLHFFLIACLFSLAQTIVNSLETHL